MPSVFNHEGRTRKAITTLVVLKQALQVPLKQGRVLIVGGSSGIVDHYLADHFAQVIGLDIDEQAIRFAHAQHRHPALAFLMADAQQLPFTNNRFDAVVCSHVYEHVPDAARLMQEIYRVLKPGGCCYFAAGNRLNIMEPHYRLPFLSVIPRAMAHWYMRIAGKGTHYYEKHLSYWGLRRLAAPFVIDDYSCRMIEQPDRFAIDYMLPPGSLKHKVAKLLCRYAVWLMPSYIWILKKPA
jgi:2-polyprenyl-3-methyl-5-hydroxy-6-metoxy-1,4-benzoquinol methylase